MLEKDLALAILKQIYHYQQEKIKVIGSENDELGGRTVKKSIGLRAKTYSYLKDNNDEDKKKKGQKHSFLQGFSPTKFKSKVVFPPFAPPSLNFRNLVPLLWLLPH